MTRQQLLDILTPLLVQETGATQTEAQNVLSTYSTDELHQQFYKAMNGGRLNHDGTLRTITPAPPVTLVDIGRAKAEHQAELARIRADAQRERIRLETVLALDREEFIMQNEKQDAPRRKAEAAAKERNIREVFPVVCRRHGLSECESNFRLLLDANALDSELSAAQFIVSHGGLAPASPEELAKFEQERIEQHNERLLRATPTELRQAVRTEAEQRRVQMTQEAAAEADRAHQARDAAKKFPPLPNERLGKILDSAYIKRADRTELRFLIQRYGESAVTARLRGQ